MYIIHYGVPTSLPLCLHVRAYKCHNSFAVHVKIADLGISQTMTPGGVMGFKGSPGFMAPEILKYVGLEACTEKVDIFSYAMFLYEMISLYFPFEKQNLMKAQIEKLVTEEERPSLQSRVCVCLCVENGTHVYSLVLVEMCFVSYSKLSK